MKHTTGDTANDSPISRAQLLKSRWLNPRSIRLWAVVIVLLYTLAGFFLLPHLAKRTLIGFIENDLGRSAHIEKLAFNPYALSLRIQGFEMADTDTVKLAAFDEFFVNLQLSSLFNWAWTFDAIKLTGAYVYSERLNAEESRWQLLLEALATEEQATEEQATAPDTENTGLPRLLIHSLSISNSWVEFKDNVPTLPVELRLGSIDINIKQLSSLPDRDGQQNVVINLPGNASLQWEGNLTLSPFSSAGTLKLHKLQLDKITPYLQELLPLHDLQATFSSRFHYLIQESITQENPTQAPANEIQLSTDKRTIKAQIDQLELELDDLAISGLTPTTEFLSVAKIALQDGVLRYPEHTLHFSGLTIENPNVITWLDTQGKLNLEALIPVTEEDTTSSLETTPEQSAWQIGVDALTVNGADIEFTDHSIEPAGAIKLKGLQLNLTELSNQNGKLFPFQLSSHLLPAGQFNLDGKLGIFPALSLQTKGKTDAIPLSIGKPYVQQSALIDIKAGVLNTTFDLAITPKPTFTIGGSIHIPGLEITDLAKQQALINWKTFNLERFDLDLQANTLNLSNLVFEQPYGRFIVHKDRSTNTSELIVEQTDTADTSSQSEAMQLTIGGITVNDGTMDFSDLSLPLPFATRIGNLKGNISTISSHSTAPAKINLEGQINKYGLSRIKGTISPLDPIRHTDIKLEFRNIKMSDASPYSAQFAGRKIAEGKLDLDLQYTINKGLMVGENKVVLHDLELGEKIEHPDATDLPLGLAIALLKDGDGIIKVDLPVTGDINDPQFKVGGVIWDAFATLIKKAAAAPFKLLGKLVGMDSEDFGQLQFLAGRSDLTPPELEKILLLQKALQQRTELSIIVSGTSNPDIDIPALQLIQLANTVRKQLGEESKADNAILNGNTLLDDNVVDILVDLFHKRFPDVRIKALKAEHRRPPADKPEGKAVFDKLAYVTDLRDRLLATEIIQQQDLIDLAQARALSVQAAILSNEAFEKHRIIIGDPKEIKSADTEWVTLELALTQK